MPPTAGSSTAEQPRFYYDFASPESYLAAERALHALGEVPEWIPVDYGAPAFRCAEEVAFYRGKVMAAKHFVSYVLPNVHARVAAMVGGDRSALDIPDAGFSGA